MRKIVFTFFLAVLSIPALYAQDSMLPQSDERQVEAVINELFNGYKAGDSLRVKNTFTENATLQTAFYNKEGQSQLSEPMPLSKFLAYIGAGLEKEHDERLWNLTIHIDNNLASAWTNYAFYLDGQFLHCGAENFLLTKTSEGWRIFHLVDTRQQTGCKVPEQVKHK